MRLTVRHIFVKILPKFDDIIDFCYNISVIRQDTVTVGLEAKMNRQSNTEKLAALYVRLSRDDENEGDSNSIAHHDVLCKGRIYPSFTQYIMTAVRLR